MNARYVAIVIGLLLLVGIVGFSSLLSGAIGLFPEGTTPPPVTTSAPPAGNGTTGGTGEPGASPAPTTGSGTASAPETTVAPTVYIEQDSTPLTDTPAPTPSSRPSDPVTTGSTSVPSVTTGRSTTAPAVTDTPDRVPGTGSGPSPVAVEIRAEGEVYSPSKVTVPAGSEVTIVFENQDVDIPHNVIIFQDRDAPIFVGTIVEGPGRTTDTFIAPSTPGTYTIGCSIPSPHRKGTLIVE